MRKTEEDQGAKLVRAMTDVLLGGDHEEIRKWRLARAFERTLEKRPELLELLKGEEPLDRRDET